MRPEWPHRCWWTMSSIYWNAMSPRMQFANNLCGSPACISFFTWPHNNPGLSSKGVAVALRAAENYLNYDPLGRMKCSYIPCDHCIFWYSWNYCCNVAKSVTDWLTDSVRLKLKNYKWYQVETFTHYSWHIWQCTDFFHSDKCIISKKKWALTGP